jgi:hypothetical protein
MMDAKKVLVSEEGAVCTMSLRLCPRLLVGFECGLSLFGTASESEWETSRETVGETTATGALCLNSPHQNALAIGVTRGETLMKTARKDGHWLALE